METADADDAGQHDDASQHDRWMQRALDLADAAVRQGEVPVGAVFVVDGVEVARGANETNGAMDATRHAELVAVDAALAVMVEGLEDELSARRAAIRSSPADLPPAPKV